MTGRIGVLRGPAPARERLLVPRDHASLAERGLEVEILIIVGNRVHERQVGDGRDSIWRIKTKVEQVAIGVPGA